ncbi:MAG: hypothetical protein WA019_01330 [Candidatus Moraniibacteriota bacterium]
MKIIKFKIIIWQAYWIICAKLLSFALNHRPFSYFFKTLMHFEVDEIYQKNLRIQKRKTPWMTKDMKRELWQRSEKEYIENLHRQEKEAKIAVEKNHKESAEFNAKIDEFNEFLFHNFGYKQRMECAHQLQQFIDLTDIPGMRKNVFQFIDAFYEKHKK